MATYQFVPPPRDAAPINYQGKNTNVKKARIWQIFESTIELDELSLESADVDHTQKIESIASIQYPLIKINDYFIDGPEIDFMTIDATGFIPRITLQCTFVHQTFLSKEMPKDGDIISVAIRNKSDLLKAIRNDYVITGVISSKNPTDIIGPVTLTFYGVLFIPWISSSKYNFSFAGTSYEALKDLAKKMSLGFATNEDNTKDKQIWISGHTTFQEFIEDTAIRAWRDEKSFYEVWIDIYYNLNFVNLNHQLMGSEDEVDIGTWLNNIDKEYEYGEDQDYVLDTPKVLSNYDGYRATSFYINKWRPINRATKVTYEVGTRAQCNLFEHNQNIYKSGGQKYWKILMDPIYDEGKVDKYILLRGRAKQIPELRGTEMAQANYSYPDLYVKSPWMGIQYTISNPNENPMKWDGNHHKNYLRARLQNTINIKELEKLNVETTVNGLNLNIIRGDKLPIVLVKKDRVENELINKDSGGNDLLDRFYSGWFYVKGFSINYSNQNMNSIVSNFTQTFTLTRREWPPPVPVEGISKENNGQL